MKYTLKDVKEKSMTPEKKASDRYGLFEYYVARPLSYYLTIPFLYTGLSPNAISLISILPPIIALIVMYLGRGIGWYLLGWFFMFLWVVMDCVDGNVARYRKQFSRLGNVYDGMAGYVALVLSFLAVGIAASHSPGLFQEMIHLPLDMYIILGALSGIFTLYPRLVMHLAMNIVGKDSSASSLKDRQHFSPIYLIGFNITTPSGLVHVLRLIAILLHMMDLFTIGYFIINLGVMIISLRRILKES